MISFANAIDVAQEIDRVYGSIADLEHTRSGTGFSVVAGAADEIRRPRRC